MRVFLGLFIAAAAATVSGFAVPGSSILSARQDGYPACAQTCLENPSLGSCSAADITCLCKESSFVDSTTQCFQANCNGTDLTTAEAVAQDTCKAAGVTLTSSVPAATSTSPSGSNSTTSPSSTSSATPSASTSAKSNGAASHTVNIICGAAALGLAGLML